MLKILFIIADISMFIIGYTFIMLPDIGILSKIFILLFSIIICVHFTSVFLAKITIDNEYITINCGIFFRKKIPLCDIVNVRYVNDNDRIIRGHPIFSKNGIAIKYNNDKMIFVSVKERNEFLNVIVERCGEKVNTKEKL